MPIIPGLSPVLVNTDILLWDDVQLLNVLW